jgi:Uncharacterized conserved protein
MAEIVVKKSKFYANVAPVTTEEEAIAFISEIKKQNTTATHNVYAYILRERNLSRYTDDGEPSMTAGIPTYEVLAKQRICDVCVVITRYFGGTLLGTGGLVRAYSGACKEGLKAAGVVEKQLCDILELVCDYSLYGKVEYSIKTLGYTILDTKFEAMVTILVCVETPFTKAFCDRILDDTNVLVVPRVIETRFVDKDVLIEEDSL